jgi:hypothetical protein
VTNLGLLALLICALIGYLWLGLLGLLIGILIGLLLAATLNA